MFDSPKTKFLKTLLNKIEEWYSITGNMNLYNGYRFSFEWFDIYVETLYNSNVYRWTLRNGSAITNNRDDEWFFSNIVSILKNKEQEKESSDKKRLKLEKKIYEESMEEKYQEYTQMLEWTKYEEWTKEFYEVIQDTKRLKEIAKEAQEIHDKYKKPFFQIFN